MSLVPTPLGLDTTEIQGTVLAANHVQAAPVCRRTDPAPPAAGTLALPELREKLHCARPPGAASCTTVKTAVAIVSCAVRSGPLFASAATSIGPLASPPLPE